MRRPGAAHSVAWKHHKREIQLGSRRARPVVGCRRIFSNILSSALQIYTILPHLDWSSNGEEQWSTQPLYHLHWLRVHNKLIAVYEEGQKGQRWEPQSILLHGFKDVRTNDSSFALKGASELKQKEYLRRSIRDIGSVKAIRVSMSQCTQTVHWS
ncbi:hypothetical protein T265_06024 [Opisthorchis viverrini]|uniref:Uncharacterized protein n=1 Tax=Opisthorchis viverrini TaxID=6198 RepID=A0A074ZIK1_OPIVI|nr:hypothetical protein T265_06024 [Opisthorchis viverrini]KER26816.1 hypothetical protein T265_06024 [Opisthorchis viverrini]